jgi:transposase-like protein
MRQRKGTGDEMLAIVTESLKEKKLVADIYREHQVSQTLYYKWRDRFLEGSRKTLDHSASGEETHRAEVEKLQKIIGKQAIQIEILKKRRICSGKSRGAQSVKGFGLYGEGRLSCP